MLVNWIDSFTNVGFLVLKLIKAYGLSSLQSDLVLSIAHLLELAAAYVDKPLEGLTMHYAARA